MDDAIIDLLNADASRLKHRNNFNITTMSFAPKEMAASIQKHIPDFEMTYDVDPVRQGIADSWPNAIDASSAREEWDFNPKYDLDKMTQEMLKQLSKKFASEGIDTKISF